MVRGRTGVITLLLTFNALLRHPFLWFLAMSLPP